MKNRIKVFYPLIAILLLSVVTLAGCKVNPANSSVPKIFTVTFNANDGNENPATAEQEFIEGGPQYLKFFASLNFSKSGYTFSGWATSADAVSAEYSDGQPFTATKDITLYAVWKANQYTITFNPDNGSDPVVITQAFGSAITAPANPVKEGYTFTSWDRAIPETMPAENITITAQWTKNQYTITFNLDNGSEAIILTQDFGSSVSAPGNPTKEFYSFSGWDKAIPETMPAENITITALWTINQYTITFNPDNGTDPLVITQDFGSNITAPANPVKEGCSFSGWDKAIPETMPAENITITAQWTINQYTITFNPDNGTDPLVITQDFGSSITAPANPVKEGYTFTGWDKAIPETMPAENLTITAQWTINQYTITFNSDNGNEAIILTQDFGSSITAPENPLKTGYSFSSWDRAIPKTMPAENLTITAQWTINQYTITFNPDNGNEAIILTQDFGSSITAPANPVKEGCSFSGWDKAIPKTMPAENLTITAQWTPLFSVTLVLNLENADVTVTQEGLTFTATPGAAGDYTYEWYFNGVKQASQENTFTLNAEGLTAGYYELIVSAISSNGINYTSSYQVTINQ